MLTRRSRKEGASPNNDAPPKTKKSPATRRKSRSKSRNKSRPKSVERKLRTRSRSSNKKPTIDPKVILVRYDKSEEKLKKETKKKKSTDSSLSSPAKKNTSPKLSKIVAETTRTSERRSSPFVDNINNVTTSTTASSKLVYDYGSDDEFDESKLKSGVSWTNTPPVEFGGTIGNLILAILLPILVILSKIALKTKGNLVPFPRGYLRLANYYDQDVFIWTGAIVILQFLISLVPLAKKSEGLKSGDFRLYYRFSGFFNLIIGALIVALMDFYKCPINFIVDIVTKRTVPHVVASVLFTLIISIILYIKSKYTNQINRYDTFNFVQKLFIGTTNNPTFGSINVKLALYRYAALMTILFNSLVIIDSLNHPINIHLYLVAGFQIFYAIDKLVFEFNLLPSFYLQKENDGYWTLIQYFLQPAINFLPIQILLSINLPTNYINLSISSTIFLLGYICQRYNDFIKYQYETNNKLSGGRKVVLDGLWSYVRQPNYLGTIIVHLALTLPIFEPNLLSFQTSWPVILYPLYYIVTLSHRCKRVSTYQKLQYGYTWDQQYSVKWNLIPKIF